MAASKGAIAYNVAKAAERTWRAAWPKRAGRAVFASTRRCRRGDPGQQHLGQQWRQARAAQHGISPDELGLYRSEIRSKSTLPEDLAEASRFWPVAQRRTTGAMLTVDGGVPNAYPR